MRVFEKSERSATTHRHITSHSNKATQPGPRDEEDPGRRPRRTQPTEHTGAYNSRIIVARKHRTIRVVTRLAQITLGGLLQNK